MIKDKAKDNKFLSSGGVEADERETIRELQKNLTSIIVASYGTFSQALIYGICITLFLVEIIVNLA